MNYKKFNSYVPKLSFDNKMLIWFGGVILFLFVMWLLSKFVKKESKTFEKLFKKNRSHFKRGKSESKGEALCRKICYEIFGGREFKKIRPKQLRNNVTGHNLELDLYNDELKLAVEYNGKQHYEFVPFFHGNREAFLNQKYRDELKRMMCKGLGIRLIEIPYTVKLEDLESFIRMQTAQFGIDLENLPPVDRDRTVKIKAEIVDEDEEEMEAGEMEVEEIEVEEMEEEEKDD